MFGSDEDIKIGLSDGKVLGILVGNVDVIIPGLDVGTDMVLLEWSLDFSNYGKLLGMFLNYLFIYSFRMSILLMCNTSTWDHVHLVNN